MNEIFQKAFSLQTDLDAIIKQIRPKLVKVAEKKHYRLGETIEQIRFDEESVHFTAGGYCMGYFEHDFDVTYEELEKMD